MQRQILDSLEIDLLVRKLAYQILETDPKLSDTYLIAIQPRGGALMDRVIEVISKECDIDCNNISGYIDHSFFRDDFRRRDTPIKLNQTKINFVIEDKRVILIDDVLFTGRSVNAAISALQAFGRPSSVELLVMLDRRFKRELPIEPNYFGMSIDTIINETVFVNWKEIEGEDKVYIEKK